MRSWMSDIIVTLSTLTVAAGFGYLYYLDVNQQIASGNREPIGKITYEHNVTQRRYGNRVVWQQVGDSAPLYNQDSIRTASGSNAVIQLADGTRIALSPNSLVTLDWGPKTRAVDFLSGSITAIRNGTPAPRANPAAGSSNGRSGAPAVPAGLVIRSGRSQVIVNQATVNLAQSGGGRLAVDVASGQADLASGSSVQKVMAAQSANVNTATGAATVSNLTVSPIAPSPGAIVVTSGKTASIGFSWKSASAAKGSTLQLSPGRSFDQSVRSFAVAGESTKVELAPGNLYWRVTAGSATSPVQQLTILRGTPVVTRSPAAGAVFRYLTEPPFIGFSWHTSENAGSYELELSKDPKFTTLFKQISVSTTDISLNSLDAGTYYWRIVPVYGYGSADPKEASAAASFRVVRETALRAATLVAPADGADLSVLSVGSKGVLFNWAAERAVASWTLVLARNRGLTNVVTRETTSNNYFLLRRLLAPGSYYWRLSGTDSQGSRTPPSPVRSFTVHRRAATITATSPKEDWNYDGATFANIPVEWNSNLGGAFEVDLATTSDFSKLYNRITTDFQHTSFGRLPSGTYFWRVSLLTPGGTRLLSSPTRTFTVLAPLLAPQAVDPAPAKSLDLVNPKNLTFQWNGDPRSKYYDFALYRTGANGTGYMIASAKNLTSNQYVLTDLGILGLGSYTWLVQTDNPALPQQSAQQSPQTQSEFTIRVLRFIPSPQLVSPAQNGTVSGVAALDRGLKFSWVSPDPRGSAVVQIASDPAFSKNLQERYAGPGTTTVSLPQLLPGTYYWRVKAKTHDGVDAPASAVNEFTIAPLPTLEQPQKVTPADGSTVVMWNKGSITFSWSPIPDASTYSISLRDAKTGRPVFREDSLTKTSFSYSDLHNLSVGQFVWSIQATQYDDAGRAVRTSTPLEIKFAISLGKKIEPAHINSPRRFYVH